MTIKDFHIGQTAYMIYESSLKEKNFAEAVTVVKVGRKYVTVNDGGWQREIRFFESHTETPYLFEDRDRGARRLLFLTTEAVDEYNELNDLRSWVQEATNWMKVKDYTLAQLRAVKKILKGDNHGGVAQESDQGD